jgi:hypothetical protein
MPPELLQAIIEKGGFTPEVIAVLQQNGLL